MRDACVLVSVKLSCTVFPTILEIWVAVTRLFSSQREYVNILTKRPGIERASFFLIF